MTFCFSQRILVNLESRMATCSQRAVQKSAMEQVANERRTEKRKKFLFIYDACGHLKTRLWFYGARGPGLEGFSLSLMLLTSSLKSFKLFRIDILQASV